MAVYTLAVAEGGLKLTATADDPNKVPNPGFGMRLGRINASDMAMGDVAFMLGDSLMDRPVLDRTGVAGRFDFTLTWTPDEFQYAARGLKPPPPADPDKAPPDFYTALREQLGLKLESAKAPTDIIVVDHVEEPTPN